MQTIAQLVNELFDTHRKSDGKEYTHVEIAMEMGGAIDPSYLSKLRSNKVPNPGRQTLLVLCRAFRVPPTYFFPELTQDQVESGDDQNPQAQLRTALRSAGLDPDVQRKVEALINALRKAE